MRAQRFYEPSETDPLRLEDVPRPAPAARELLVRVHTCGVCHTDLHLVDGELPNPKQPVTPGHQVVGVVEQVGEGATRFQIGARVGVFWLYYACGTCDYCRRELENLCESALFTGYTADGGYADYLIIREDFAVPIPDSFSGVDAAPLLCAGIVGYRSLRLSDLQRGERLGLYGFGASAHICIQVARYWNCEVYAFTRSEENQLLAREYGAKWVGDALDNPPTKLDRAIIFAPAGWIVPLALGHLRKGGTLCINAIHMSPIPEMPYNLLWHERTIRSVANVTRRDAEEFLPLAAQIPIRTTTEVYDLTDANLVLGKLKRGEIKGAAVLQVS